MYENIINNIPDYIDFGFITVKNKAENSFQLDNSNGTKDSYF